MHPFSKNFKPRLNEIKLKFKHLIIRKMYVLRLWEAMGKINEKIKNWIK